MERKELTAVSRLIPLTVMVRSVSTGKEAIHLCDHDMLELLDNPVQRG